MISEKEMDNISEIVEKSGLKHIAFIMDGNGRWATKRGLPREFGHKAGAETFKKIVRYCRSIGIKTATVYAFSTENIKRPKREVNAIFRLLGEYVEEGKEEKDVEFKFIGAPEELGEDVYKKVTELESTTKGGKSRVNVAFNYGGRAEIVHAVNKLLKDNKTVITEDDISANVYTSDVGDPDLIIRTGNEVRISNFLLWQCAYSELYFSETLWPDFSTDELDKAIMDFSHRSRRWGGLDTKK